MTSRIGLTVEDRNRVERMARRVSDGVPRFPVPMLGCGFTAEDVIDHRTGGFENVALKLQSVVTVGKRSFLVLYCGRILGGGGYTMDAKDRHPTEGDREDREDTKSTGTQEAESGFCRYCWGYTWMHQHDCPVVADSAPGPSEG